MRYLWLQAEALSDEDKEKMSAALAAALQEKSRPCPLEVLEKYRLVWP